MADEVCSQDAKTARSICRRERVYSILGTGNQSDQSGASSSPVHTSLDSKAGLRKSCHDTTVLAIPALRDYVEMMMFAKRCQV